MKASLKSENKRLKKAVRELHYGCLVAIRTLQMFMPTDPDHQKTADEMYRVSESIRRCISRAEHEVDLT